VRNALSYLEPGPFLVIYGDVFFDESITPLIRTHRRRRPAATLAVHEEVSAAGKGVVELDSGGRVTHFIEKGEPGPGRFLINSGIYVLESDFTRSLPRGVFLDFGHHVLPQAVEAGAAVVAQRLNRPVIDIGTHYGLAMARARAEAP
jgi:NDP-sugar pyrophosphorylase family protein